MKSISAIILLYFISIIPSAAQSDHLTDPKIVVLGKSGETISLSRSQLNELKSISTSLPDKTEVVGFYMSCKVGESLIEIESKSNLLNQEMKDLLNSQAKIQLLYIEKIRIKMNDGTVRSMPLMTIRVRNH